MIWASSQQGQCPLYCTCLQSLSICCCQLPPPPLQPYCPTWCIYSPSVFLCLQLGSHTKGLWQNVAMTYFVPSASCFLSFCLLLFWNFLNLKVPRQGPHSALSIVFLPFAHLLPSSSAYTRLPLRFPPPA